MEGREQGAILSRKLSEWRPPTICYRATPFVKTNQGCTLATVTHHSAIKDEACSSKCELVFTSQSQQ